MIRELVGQAIERAKAAVSAPPLAVANTVGSGARVDGVPTVTNGGRMEIGARFRFASSPVASHMVTGPSGALLIGDDVSIGHGAAIAAYGEVKIGDGSSVGPYVIIMDTDFHELGKREVSHGDATFVRIGRGVKIGPRVTILKGTEIGDGAEILAGSVVSGPVAKGAKVGGVPARPVRDANAAESSDDISEELPKVIAQTFGLSAPPALTSSRYEVQGWDSLGSLRLVLALEDAFGVAIEEEAMVKAKAVQDLVTAIEAAKEKRAAHAK